MKDRHTDEPEIKQDIHYIFQENGFATIWLLSGFPWQENLKWYVKKKMQTAMEKRDIVW
jgi:hypothetical protein